MTAEEVFNALTVDGKIQLLEKMVDVTPEAVRKEVAAWIAGDVEPRFSDLLYDVQDAIGRASCRERVLPTV